MATASEVKFYGQQLAVLSLGDLDTRCREVVQCLPAGLRPYISYKRNRAGMVAFLVDQDAAEV